MRLIILDTETTGLNPKDGHRIVEIGCIEMVSFRLTGRHFHTYINPEREIPKEATHVHGITTEFVKKWPLFSQIVDQFLDFIQDDPLVIHNAPFDMGFLNAELEWAQKPLLDKKRAINTLTMARQKYPGEKATLDALCKKFDIDLSKRDKHGALLDAELLSQVYIEMMGGRQKTLENVFSITPQNVCVAAPINQTPFPDRIFNVTRDEVEAHHAFINDLTQPLWKKFYATHKD